MPTTVVPEPAIKSTTLVNRRTPDQTPDAPAAEMMVEGPGMNAATAVAYSRTPDDLDLAECLA